MDKSFLPLAVVVFVAVFSGGCHQTRPEPMFSVPVPSANRTVAVTVDDLPTVGALDLIERQIITGELVSRLISYEIPATAFVNEIKLGDPFPDPQEVALLKTWLDAGFDLANHSHSHFDFSETPLDEFTADVLRGELVTRPLMQAHGKDLRYFRHPYLRTGNDSDKRRALEAFLADHSYVIAPVTVGNSDWIYNAAYNRARLAGDESLMARLVDDYVRHTEEMFEFVERYSSELLGYELPQIFLMHANRINAEHFDRLAEMMISRGYSFITLEEALENHTYESSEGLIMPNGLAWIHRQWVEKGFEPKEWPGLPDWVHSAADLSD